MENNVQNSEETAFKKRLRLVASELGGLKQLSERTGIKYGTLQKYLLKNGAPDPTRSVIKKIVDSCQLSAQWLLIGTGEMFVNDVKGMHALPWFDLRVYENHIEENCIDNKVNGRGELDVRPLPFPGPAMMLDKFTIENLARTEALNPKALVCYRISDDDMAPLLPAHGTVLIDLSNTSIVNGTYLVKLQEPEGYSVTVREIQTAGPDRAHLLAPAAFDREMTPQEMGHQHTVIGKLVSSGLQPIPRMAAQTSYAEHRVS